jgi:hypothetical protein
LAAGLAYATDSNLLRYFASCVLLAVANPLLLVHFDAQHQLAHHFPSFCLPSVAVAISFLLTVTSGFSACIA